MPTPARKINWQELRPGDVLILDAGQFPYISHCLIMIETPKNRPYPDPYDPVKNAYPANVAHTVRTLGAHRGEIYSLYGGGTVVEGGMVSTAVAQVFRSKHADKAADAAKVAMRWAPYTKAQVQAMLAKNGGFDKEKGSGYSIRKGIRAALGSSSYGSGAKKRAAYYHKYRDELGGPRAADDTWFGDTRYMADEHKEMMCVMFVIACWQAAVGADDAARYMAVDATHTLPKTLRKYLMGSAEWTHVALDIDYDLRFLQPESPEQVQARRAAFQAELRNNKSKVRKVNQVLGKPSR